MNCLNKLLKESGAGVGARTEVKSQDRVDPKAGKKLPLARLWALVSSSSIRSIEKKFRQKE